MSELFADTFEIMLAGMGGVFIFLIVLTFAVVLLTKFFPETAVSKADQNAQSAAEGSTESATASDTSAATKLAAVTVAVQKYRQARGSAADQQE